MEELQELLNKLKDSKFLVASRSRGYICPGTMRMMSFEEAIGFGSISIWSTGPWFRSGIYLAEGDGFTNVHRQIRKLLKAGLLEITDSEKTNYGQPIKTLRIKEQA